MPYFALPPLPASWQRAFNIVAHVSGSLSLFGSTWIITEVLLDRKKRGRVYHRLLLGMSCYDALSSLWIFLASWPMPAGSWYRASGTYATCAAQSFFIVLGLAAPMYSASLSLYYLLQLKYNWRDGRFARRVERRVHGFAALLSLFFASVQIPLGMYYTEDAGPWCTAFYPRNTRSCDTETASTEGDVGGRQQRCNESSMMLSDVVNLALYVVVWCCTIFSTGSMIAVYRSVRTLERRVTRYTVFAAPVAGGRDGSEATTRLERMGSENATPGAANSNSNSNANNAKEQVKRSRAVAVLGILYLSAYLLTWAVASLGVLLISARRLGLMDGWTPQLERRRRIVQTITVILYPLQGWFNFLIYIRPRYLKHSRQQSPWSPRKALLEVFRFVRRRHIVTDDDDESGSFGNNGNQGVRQDIGSSDSNKNDHS